MFKWILITLSLFSLVYFLDQSRTLEIKNEDTQIVKKNSTNEINEKKAPSLSTSYYSRTSRPVKSRELEERLSWDNGFDQKKEKEKLLDDDDDEDEDEEDDDSIDDDE